MLPISSSVEGFRCSGPRALDYAASSIPSRRKISDFLLYRPACGVRLCGLFKQSPQESFVVLLELLNRRSRPPGPEELDCS